MAKISMNGDIVTMTQETTVLDGVKVELRQQYNFTNTPKATLIQWATANRVIAWRAHNDVKNLAPDAIRALPTVIDCSVEFESSRVPKARNPFLEQLDAISTQTGIPVARLVAMAEAEATKMTKTPERDLIADMVDEDITVYAGDVERLK